MADPFNITSDQLSGMGATPAQIQQFQNGSFNFGGGAGNSNGGNGTSGLFSNGFGAPPVFGGSTGAGAGVGLGAGLGANIGTGQLALGALGTLGNLWTSWNADQLAQKSFNFQKTLASDNYTNQADSYNTNLQDIASSRAKMENQTQSQEQAYVAANQLKTTV
jgi:hypothetical protein